MDEKGTYVIKEATGLFRHYKESKILCVPCNRNMKIESINFDSTNKILNEVKMILKRDDRKDKINKLIK